jgi:hypothetical protein
MSAFVARLEVEIPAGGRHAFLPGVRRGAGCEDSGSDFAMAKKITLGPSDWACCCTWMKVGTGGFRKNRWYDVLVVLDDATSEVYYASWGGWRRSYACAGSRRWKRPMSSYAALAVLGLTCFSSFGRMKRGILFTRSREDGKLAPLNRLK